MIVAIIEYHKKAVSLRRDSCKIKLRHQKFEFIEKHNFEKKNLQSISYFWVCLSDHV